LSLKELRWTSVVIGMLLSFGTLIAGNLLYQQYLVKAPLEDALSQRTEIMDWSLQKETNKTVLIIELGPVSNLKESCSFIQEITSRYLGDDGVEILIADHRTPELEEVKYALQFSLYEALAQGNFTKMSEMVNTEVEKAKLSKHQVFVDENYLYIQLFRDEDYLYEVIPRASGQQTNIIIKGISELEKDPDTNRLSGQLVPEQ